MKKFNVKILSEISIDFFKANVYLVQSKIDLDQKELLDSEEAFYLNYPFDEAAQVVPFFEGLKIKEQTRIVKSIEDTYGFKVRVDDLFGKLLVALFYNIELHDFLIIGLIGIGENSVNTLIELLKKTVSKEKFKVVILTKTSIGSEGSVSLIKL